MTIVGTGFSKFTGVNSVVLRGNIQCSITSVLTMNDEKEGGFERLFCLTGSLLKAPNYTAQTYGAGYIIIVFVIIYYYHYYYFLFLLI